MGQLARGVRDVQHGFGVLRAHPALWKWVIAPAVASAALLAALVLLALHESGALVGWVVSHLPGWLAQVAGPLLTTMILAVLLVGVWLVFVPLAGLVAGPFNEMLSEHVEAQLTGRPASPFSFAEFLHGLGLGVVHSIRRLVAMLVGIALVFGLSFIPVVGTIAAAVVAAWLAATGAAYDCYDAVLARRMMGYRAKLAYLAHHRRRSLGLGGVVAAMLLVPGLNLIALGIGTAGATVAVHAIERNPVAGRRSG
ncbi:MAG TPA: EI24 domain-containing protein [Kofleriaceae bacterium]|nr:EI24 domain-containing protein [Kofleriaceae bacterium]